MVSLNEALSIVYKYYPQKVSYNEPEYINSIQFNEQLKVKKRHVASNIGENYEKGLQQLFKNYSVANWTDLGSANCYEYRILVHEKQQILDDDIELMRALNGTRLDLHLFISILENYLFLFACKTTFDFEEQEWYFENANQYNSEILNICNKVTAYFNMIKFKEVTAKIAKKIVPDVETQYAEMGKTSIFNCLFTDLETIIYETNRSCGTRDGLEL